MVFSSVLFLFVYLPIVLALYYISPLKWRNVVLLLVSLFFYGWGEPVYIFIMILSILIDYTHGLLVEKYRANDKLARKFVVSSVVCNLLLLGIFKYLDFIIINLNAIPLFASLGIDPVGLPLPIGISFFTFQTMSYTIDVYRNDAPAQRNILTFGSYVTLFPQLIAGPIIKYKDVADQLDGRKESMAKFASGVQLFVIGLAKKVLLANNIGMLWDNYAAMNVGELSVLGSWLGIIAYGFQIFFDFSGYSDMAIGLGRMFGFEFKKNFNYPYISKSITEFWRRWHISLGSWFREYVYIPLGGNRVKLPRQYFNILVVWALTGIWHGANWNFMFWGLYFAFWLVLEKTFLLKLLAKVHPAWGHIYTLLVVTVSWALFAIENSTQLAGYVQVMFGLAGAPLVDGTFFYYLLSYLPMLIVLTIASTPLGANLMAKVSDRTKQIAIPVLIVIGLLACTAYLVDSSYNPFLYFRF